MKININVVVKGLAADALRCWKPTTKLKLPATLVDECSFTFLPVFHVTTAVLRVIPIPLPDVNTERIHHVAIANRSFTRSFARSFLQ